MNLDNHDDLVKSLQELDATPAETAAWEPIVQQMAEWPHQRITPSDTRRLLSILEQIMPQRSTVRKAIYAHYNQQNRLVTLLATAYTQISVLRLTFWVLSTVIILLGVAIELALPHNTVLVSWIRTFAPLLAYLCIASAFRGVELHTLEWELACPPSTLQLIVARLVIVLGYDVGLGMLLSLVTWAQGGESFLGVTLYWLVPLLLTAGLALILSLWLPVSLAASLAYSGWLALLFLGSSHLYILLSLNGELILGVAGLFMLVIALWRFTRQVPRHFLSTTM